MLTDRNGTFFTQRQVPKMAVVSVAVGDDSATVSANGFGALEIAPEPESGTKQKVTVWWSQVEALVYNGKVSEWFSDVLGRECQLVLMPETTERHVSEQFDRGDDIVSFADGFPLLVANEASLEELNRRIEIAGETPAFHPLPMNRFRPNLVVKGSEPFAEDGWAKIRVGDAVFRVAKPCARCVMPTIDQATGEFDGKEPSKTLASFRMAKEVFPETFEAYGINPTAVLFGENLIPENPGVSVRVGDEVEVLEWR